jgi:hypothetical protein
MSLPPEGIFENCPLDQALQACVTRLGVMHEGGFRVVVVPASGLSLSSLIAYATAARDLGMSVMWELSNPGWWRDATTSSSMASPFAAFAAACGCVDNGALLAYLVRWLGSLSGTYGYYAADTSMLAPGDSAGVAAYIARIKQQDPTHTVMIGVADESQAGQYQGIADLVGYMVYPFTTESLLPVSDHLDMWNAVAQTASDVQRLADNAHKQSAFILQAFTWGDNLDDGLSIGACSPSDSKWTCYQRLRYPSQEEQLQLRNEILQHADPKLILWWSFPGTYGDVTGDTYSIYPAGVVAAARWQGLSAAIRAPMPQFTTRHTTPPITIVKVASAQKLKTVLHHGVTITVLCTQKSTVLIELLLAADEAKRLGLKRLVGRGTGATGKTIAIKLAPRAKPTLSKLRKFHLTLMVKTTNPDGDSTTTTKTMTVTRQSNPGRVLYQPSTPMSARERVAGRCARRWLPLIWMGPRCAGSRTRSSTPLSS